MLATSVTYDEESDFPVVVHARLEVHFKDGFDASQRPTAEEILGLGTWSRVRESFAGMNLTL